MDGSWFDTLTQLLSSGLGLTAAGLLVTAILLVITLAWKMSGSSDVVSRRLAGEAAAAPTFEKVATLRQRERKTLWNDLLGGLEKHVAFMGGADKSTLRRKLIQAGYIGPTAVRNYFGIRVLLALLLPLIVVIQAPIFLSDWDVKSISFLIAMSGMLGLYLPRVWVSKRITNRQISMSEGFPDTLDMLVVCVEAGLALDAAFVKVGTQIANAYPLLAMQFGIVALELRAGKSRSAALRNLATRTGLAEIASFVTLLIQSDTLGASISQALRVHSDEMRAKRTLIAEEKAHKLPVLLSIPLVVCILPSMIAVILLPGGILIVRKVIPALVGN